MSGPNILFVMTDQFRFDATGLNGGWARTPVLDRLAAEGINYTGCYTNSPICMPARISMATGLYPHNTNVWCNIRYFLPTTVNTWTQLIRRAGYRTALFGKTHYYHHNVKDMRDHENILRACGLDVIDEVSGPRACVRVMSNMTEGWQKKGLLQPYIDDFRERFATKPHLARPSTLPLEEYYDVYVAEQARRFLEDYRGAEPWFCWLSFGGPHDPWDAPEPYASMYDPAGMPEPIMPVDNGHSRPLGYLDTLLGKKSPAWVRARDAAGPDGPAAESRYESSVADVPDTNTFSPDFEPGDIAKMRANYAGSVTLIDEQIGRVLSAVEQRGELENTVVLFTSDHGEMNGDYGLVYKREFLNSAVKVPLIIRAPRSVQGDSGGKTCGSIVEWFDIGATLSELTGGRLDYRQFARSFVHTLKNPAESHRTDALSEILGEHMLVNNEWKIVINTEGKAYLLFDLEKDPAEQRNLAGLPEYREIEERLRLRILERISASHINEG
ncbi:MAG: sulfatase-like hydrolase/transferase [Spirochaetales bacterium]|nr:sulfatase-like hydrolase/transferase [Spirochaetales bacterium]